jgi:predicted Zn finger-like uncharacterized protein
MSLVTRCTSCGTLFKVVADQLKISEGWVRCGQCAAVFDAQANLVADTATTHAVTPIPTAPQIEPTPDTAQTVAAKAHHDQDISFDEIADFKRSRSIQLPGLAQESLPSGYSSSLPAASLPSPLDSLPNSAAEDSQLFKPGGMRDLPSDFDDDDRITTNWAASQLPSTSHEDTLDPALHSTPPSTLQAPLAHPPTFVTQAQRAARWRTPWIRFGLALIALALLAGLALQIAVQEKDRIAAMQPHTAPWLTRLCSSLDCQVQPLKQIESIAVDASSFNRINKNNATQEAATQSYLLAVTLKNTGTLAVAVPHVELSLQDAQDAPILRRVLSPADLGTSLQALAPTQDMAGSITLQVNTSSLAGNRISGYRVLAFYP